MTGSPAHEAIGRPDMLVEVSNPGLRYYGSKSAADRLPRHLNVETHNGTVVAVWFRGQQLPFRLSEVDDGHAAAMESADPEYLPRLEGVEVSD